MLTPEKTTPLTVQQTATIFQVRPEAIRDWIRRKEMVAVRLPGGRYRIPWTEVDRLLQGKEEVGS